MAILAGIRIDSEQESKSPSVTITQNPVETGKPLTDHVQVNPDTFTVSGFLMDPNAKKNYDKLVSLMKSGKQVTYIGRTIAKEVLISDFQASYTGEVANGIAVTLSLTEVRIAKTPLVVVKTQTQNSGKKTPTKTSTSTKKFVKVRKGYTYWQASIDFKTPLKTIMSFPENPWPARRIPIGVMMRVK